MTATDSPSFATRFNHHFELHAGTSHRVQSMAARVRHQVYCEELGWEPTAASAEEKDSFDERSAHIVICDRTNGEPVACVRLILDDGIGGGLPFELVCRDVLDPRLDADRPTDREHIAEVSRLAVVARMRRRATDRAEGAALTIGNATRYSFASVLCFGVVAMAKAMGVKRVYLMTERTLFLMFKRIGLATVQVGGEVEHKGVRIPSFKDIVAFPEAGRDGDDVAELFEDVNQLVTQALAREDQQLSMGAPATHRGSGRPGRNPSPGEIRA